MKFLIDSKVYAKVMYLVQKCDKEISGLGRVKIEGNTVRIVDMVLLEQEVTGATTDITPDAVSKALFDAYKDGGLAKGELLWWWHSHVDMGVFWSGTDMATIKEFGGKGRLFATVFNKKYESRSAYFQAGTDIYPEIFVDNIATELDYGLDSNEIAQLDKDFAELVKPKVWNKNIYIKDQDYPYKKSGRKGKKTILADDLQGHSNKYDNSFFWDDDIPSTFWDDDYWEGTKYYTGKSMKASNGGKNGNK